VSSDIVISAESVSKAYTIWSSPSARLHGPVLGQAGQLPFLPLAAREWCRQRSHQSFRNFYALKNVSFEMRRGESVGVIGRNGSGKSTLLQIVAGTLMPTEGSVTVRGNVAALLELGSGFNPDFTGRENVYMNAAIRGMSRAQTDAKFEEITAFADIGEFIDQPTKTYSSGMLVRLAFAVSACAEPELLIVDEALSVGDVFFQQKCFQRIRQMLANGTSLLFVSHDAAAVQNLCQRAILLHGGMAVFEGPPEEAVSRYHTISSTRAAPAPVHARAPRPQRNGDGAARREQLAQDTLAHNILASASSRHGARGVELVAASVLNEHGLHSLTVEMLQPMTIRLLLRARQEVLTPSAGLHLFDRMNNLVFSAGTRQLGVAMRPFEPGEERLLTFILRLAVQPGLYTFNLGCSEASAEGPNTGFNHDRHEGLGPIEVHYDRPGTLPFYGIAQLPMEVEVLE